MQARDHYAALDGLRGIAAISVLFFHLAHWQQQPWIASNAGMAVDFFFALSGYVLSTAYGAKLDGGMSIWVFMRIRLIRLMPIIILGTLISAAYLIARIVLIHDNIDLREVGCAILLGVFNLPMFNASHSIGGPQVFPLNGPQYTLFLELVVNAFWAATRRIEGIWIALTITILCYAFIAIYGFGGDTSSNFWHGFPRALGSYYSGVVVFYLQQRFPANYMQKFSFLFWPLLMITFFIFYFPYSTPDYISLGWSIIFSPLILLTGSHVQLSGNPRRVALMLGELSFPIYALHYPIFVWINGIYQQILHKKDFLIGTSLVVPLVFIITWIILRFVDAPTRKIITSWTLNRSVKFQK